MTVQRIRNSDTHHIDIRIIPKDINKFDDIFVLDLVHKNNISRNQSPFTMSRPSTIVRDFDELDSDLLVIRESSCYVNGRVGAAS